MVDATTMQDTGSAPIESESATPRRPVGLLRRLVTGVLTMAAPSVHEVKRDVVASAKTMGKSALDVTIWVLVGLVGYVFVMLGIAWLIAAHAGMPVTLLVIGGVHVAVGTIGVIWRVRKKSATPAPSPPKPVAVAPQTAIATE